MAKKKAVTRKSSDWKPFGLGDRVKDPISKFTGIVVSVTEYLHGCIRVSVSPENLKDGKIEDDRYFDQSQLELVKKSIHKPMTLHVGPAREAVKRRSNGGPSREGSGFKRT